MFISEVALRRLPATPRAFRLGAALLQILATYRQRRREREQLLALTDRELQDIGISRLDAIHAAEKPTWRF